ncbi:PREDICTED: uncharacterized protein LOC103344108 [Prunus mume]|uniref:Uncharacterized protein LOC103344108 n=1 Tax=Prunus mume TaxID=102107 RepID=A0ABM0PX59_PRUMU|nr:PREDICTED: uncharacterized protein LOC103344108 [Prunus mume]
MYATKKRKKDITALFSTKQKACESLKDYLKRFTEEMSTLETYNSHTASLAFRKGVTSRTKMHKSSVKTPPLDMREVLARADEIIRLEEEELALSKRTTTTISAPKHPYETIQGPRTKFSSGNLRNQARTNSPPTKLTVSLAKLFHENKDKGIFRTPLTLREPLEKRDRRKTCAHHNDFGHTTNDCRNLKYQVEAMLKKGMVSQYRA